jgi:hypothetical protein
MTKAERWQRYYATHRDELLEKYKARYVRNETKKIDAMIEAAALRARTAMHSHGANTAIAAATATPATVTRPSRISGVTPPPKNAV